MYKMSLDYSAIQKTFSIIYFAAGMRYIKSRLIFRQDLTVNIQLTTSPNKPQSDITEIVPSFIRYHIYIR